MCNTKGLHLEGILNQSVIQKALKSSAVFCYKSLQLTSMYNTIVIHMYS